MPATQHEVLDQHRKSLRESFRTWLLEQHPGSVLDLGAGDGSLVAELALEGVEASGIEQPGPGLDRARALGHSVVEGLIDAPNTVVPSADWVTLRHVLHHLAHPARALLRATAAARVGVLLAEPISRTGLPMHKWTMRLEALTRSLDRRSGMVHAADCTAEDLVLMLPPDWRTEIRMYAPMTPLPVDEVQAMIARSARGKELTAADQEEAEVILTAAKAGMVAPSGSLLVMAAR